MAFRHTNVQTRGYEYDDEDSNMSGFSGSGYGSDFNYTSSSQDTTPSDDLIVESNPLENLHWYMITLTVTLLSVVVVIILIIYCMRQSKERQKKQLADHSNHMTLTTKTSKESSDVQNFGGDTRRDRPLVGLKASSKSKSGKITTTASKFNVETSALAHCDTRAVSSHYECIDEVTDRNKGTSTEDNTYSVANDYENI